MNCKNVHLDLSFKIVLKILATEKFNMKKKEEEEEKEKGKEKKLKKHQLGKKIKLSYFHGMIIYLENRRTIGGCEN